ncbi:A/G-specific adenine glycosylase [Falsirhodobacter halotolerans]|uniref:A/G-specific adenine glycosylase n=1 Tax=Falsirhodobacter halotolerans TaxID=1146892 RepID=UPI001FD2C017|nr:A/G-specific adenine glycosylase [Falsirhodobacter halotolerans]MCJ8140637.1 A/G-specific adenine glycosylase [Falsirhodobacter halotolerans]
MRDENLSRPLLDWYDRHARDLPWRIPPGSDVRPDPYRIWLSEVMLQQTTVAAVRAYFARFTTRWPTVADLAAAEDAEVMAEWAGLGYYARARNLLACARTVVADHGGAFPGTEAQLRALPGIGPYTAAAIAAIAFDEPAVVIDGNVDRVMARLRAIDTPLPAAKPEIARAAAALTPADRPGDYAQAVMDLGATICTPRAPACGICPWMAPCDGRARGIAADLPRKTAKTTKPTRSGTVWLVRHPDGRWLVEDRPARGLLGGMWGWPGTGWDVAGGTGAGGDAPLTADWRDLGTVRHTFSHFHLSLRVLFAPLPAGANPERGSFRPLTGRELPTLMRKAHALAVEPPPPSGIDGP